MNRRSGGISAVVSRMRWERRFAMVPLLAAGSVLALLAFSSAAGTGIENPTCEMPGPGVYRIDFQASPSAMPVEVFASSRPDRIDSAKAVLIIRSAPAEVRSEEHTSELQSLTNLVCR